MHHHSFIHPNDGIRAGEGHRYAEDGGQPELTSFRGSEGSHPPIVSIVTPAHNEEANLRVLYERLCAVLTPSGLSWEWIVVDDHSGDQTFRVAEELARLDSRVRGVRFSRNFGSHIAIACGLDLARGSCAVVMAADLQDPPETIPELIEHWRSGSQIVWAVRGKREGQSETALSFSLLYYWMMRRVVGLTSMPPTGADFFLLDRIVVQAARQIKERNASLFALLTWMGFRQSSMVYEKQERLHGSSSWTLRKKLRLVVDSFISFSHKPIRWMAWFGLAIAGLGFIYAIAVVFNAIAGHPSEGWSSLMVAVLILCGGQMLMLGVMGEYLWRALDEVRQRPKYLIENATPPADAGSGNERIDHANSR
jgi:dolichol-phosphate mannosyltransferase